MRGAAREVRARLEGAGLRAVEDKLTGTFIGFVGLLYHDDWPEGDDKTEVGWRFDRAY